MGSCISRCSRKRKRQDQETSNLVQDKLVITQAPISLISPSSSKQLLSLPQSPTSSVSSFSCTTTSYFLTSSSSLSLCSISKERSFSNEFLKSCIKENPHIIHKQVKSSFGSTSNKRARASAKTSSDFTPSQQKSVRRETERQSSPHSFNRNVLRSPSPSRRFSSTPKENLCKPSMLGKSIVANPKASLVKRDNATLRPSSPRHNSARDELYFMTKEKCSRNRIGSKIKDIINAGEVLACKQDHDGSNIPIEDIDNPLIAFDCFIFL